MTAPAAPGTGRSEPAGGHRAGTSSDGSAPGGDDRHRPGRWRWCLLALVALVLAVPACSLSDPGGDPAPDPPSTDGPSSTARGDDDPGGPGAPDGPAADTRWEPLLEPGIGSAVRDLAFDPNDPSRVLAAGATFGIGVSTDGGTSWAPGLGLPVGGVSSIAFDPHQEGEVWAATPTGPHVSVDGGQTWQRRAAGLDMSGSSSPAPVAQVLPDPSDGDRLLALEGRPGPVVAPSPGGAPARIWESRDGGASWHLTPGTGLGEGLVAAVFLADGETVLAVSSGGRLVRSTDGGRTWAEASTEPAGGGVTAVVAHPDRAGRAWMAVSAGDAPAGGVFRTDDGGASWRPARSPLPLVPARPGTAGSRFAALAVSPGEPDTLYTADLAVEGHPVYRSDDGGATWELLPGAPSGFYAGNPAPTTLAVAPDDPARLLAGNQQSILLSVDGGQSWVDGAAPRHAEGHRGAGLSGLTATAVEAATDGSLAIQDVDRAPLLVSRPDGSWQAPLQDWDTSGGGLGASVAGEAWWALLGDLASFNGLARSSDNGLTWDVLVGDGLPERGAVLDGPSPSVLALDDESALLVVDRSLWRTADGGASWTQVSEAVHGPLVRWDGPLTVVYGAGPDGVLRSRNGGRSFQPVGRGGPRGVTSLAVDTEGRVHAAVDEGPDAGLWRHDDRWRRLLAGRAVAAVAVDPGDADHLFVALGGGGDPGGARTDRVLRSTDGGSTWAPLDEGLGVPDVRVLEFDPQDPGRVLAGTAGGGFYQLRTG